MKKKKGEDGVPDKIKIAHFFRLITLNKNREEKMEFMTKQRWCSS